MNSRLFLALFLLATVAAKKDKNNSSLFGNRSVKTTGRQNFDINRYFKYLDKKVDFSEIENAFRDFKRTFNKIYFHQGEEKARKKIFKSTVNSIFKHNNKKNRNYSQSVNQFSDLTFEEFKKKNLVKDISKLIEKEFKETGRRPKVIRLLGRKNSDRHDAIETKRLLQNLKRSVNWKPHCTGIKDQKHCAACYAFSAIAGFETMRSIVRGRKEEFSEQSMIDCVNLNNGCSSGTPSSVLDYIATKGIAKAAKYPFADKTQMCKKNLMKKSAVTRDSIDYDYLDMGVARVVEALQDSPVVLVHTVNNGFRNYKNGVLDEKNCNDELDHSTLAVGYNLDANPPYIEVKNSWGQAWGDQGYFKFAIGELSNRNGGICQYANHDYNMKLYFDD